jgi:hypothetical protein
MHGVFLTIPPFPAAGDLEQFPVNIPDHAEAPVMDQIALVQFPIRAVPDEPFFPQGLVADIRAVFGEQAEYAGKSSINVRIIIHPSLGLTSDIPFDLPSCYDILSYSQGLCG